MTAPEWVRLADITTAGLPADAVTRAVADAMLWEGAARALVLIHGQRRAAERLVQLGCPVRFDGEGEPVVWAGPATGHPQGGSGSDPGHVPGAARQVGEEQRDAGSTH